MAGISPPVFSKVFPKNRYVQRNVKHGVPSPQDGLKLSSCRSEIWHASRKHCSRDACQIVERVKKSKPKSCGFETEREGMYWLFTHTHQGCPSANVMILKDMWKIGNYNIAPKSRESSNRIHIDYLAWLVPVMRKCCDYSCNLSVPEKINTQCMA